MKAQEIYLLSNDQFVHYWPQIEGCLDEHPELWNDVWTKQVMVEQTLKGRIQVWVVSTDDVIHVVFMTQVITHPARKVLQLFWMAGEGLKPALPCISLVMDRFAVTQECKTCEVIGRAGFERLLRPFGAKFQCATYVRDVKTRKENSVMAQGGGGQATPGSQTTTTKLPKQTSELLNLAMPDLKQFAAQGIQPSDQSYVAGFDPAQTQGQEMALSTAAPGGALPAIAGTAADQSKFLGGDVLYPGTNPALADWMKAAVKPLEDTYAESTLPGIRGQSGPAGANQFGSSRQGIAEGLAAKGLAQAEGAVTSNIANTGYGQGLDAYVKGLGLAPQTANLQLAPSLATSGVGDVRQQQQQNVLGEQLSNYNLEQYAPLLVGSQLASIAGGIPGGSTTTSASTAAPASPFMTGLGGAATGASLGATIGGPYGALGGAALGGLLAFM